MARAIRHDILEESSQVSTIIFQYFSFLLHILPKSIRIVIMQAEERQKWIEQYLSKVEFASLDELARHVSASPSTVRRDLNLLEGSGHIRRTHGGACLVNPRTDDYIFTQRETIQLSEKEAIARTCARLIQQGQNVI